jgi:hypothetical protein
MMMGRRRPPADDGATRQIEKLNATIEQLRADIAGLQKRLVATESLLINLYGPSALGGGPKPEQPPVEPPKRMRQVAII